jgi:6-phosphogluconolactonase
LRLAGAARVVAGGSGDPTAVSPTVAYVSSAGSREIISFALDVEARTLSPLSTTAVPGEGPSPTSMPLALSPRASRLYAAVRSAPFPLTSYAIDGATGALAPLATAGMPDAMTYVATDRTGRWLFAASYTGAKLSLSRIDGEGRAQGPAVQVIDTPLKAHCILADLTNRWVLATSLGGDALLPFRFDAASGRLTPATPVRLRAGSGPRHLVFHPGGRLAFLLNELDGRLQVYGFDPADGTLEERQSIGLLGVDRPASSSAADLHLTPDGGFLYASERVTDSIAGFAVEAQTGRLTPIGVWPTEASPRGFAITPCGRCLLAAGQTSNRIAAYAIDAASGVLEWFADRPAGSNPNWIEIIRLPAADA